MKINKVKSGSALLLVIIAMSVLSLVCITYWQSSALFYDVSLAKLAYEKKYSATLCGLNYAIDFCSKNFDKIIEPIELSKQDNKTYEISFEIEKNKNKIFITPKQNGLHISSLLLTSQNKKIFELSCDLLQIKEDKKAKKIIIQNWKYGDF